MLRRGWTGDILHSIWYTIFPTTPAFPPHPLACRLREARDHDGEAALQSLRARAPSSSDASSGAATTAESAEGIARLRARCHNAMHITTVVLADDGIQTDVAMYNVVLSAERRRHGQMSEALRDRDAALEYIIALSCGRSETISALYATTHIASDDGALRSCGMMIDFSGPALAKVKLGDALPDSQNLLAAKLLRMQVTFMGLRLSLCAQGHEDPPHSHPNPTSCAPSYHVCLSGAMVIAIGQGTSQSFLVYVAVWSSRVFGGLHVRCEA